MAAYDFRVQVAISDDELFSVDLFQRAVAKWATSLGVDRVWVDGMEWDPEYHTFDSEGDDEA